MFKRNININNILQYTHAIGLESHAKIETSFFGDNDTDCCKYIYLLKILTRFYQFVMRII